MTKPPSREAVELVLGNARLWSRGAECTLATRVAELPGVSEPEAWGGLLLGAGFDEFSEGPPLDTDPATLEDVARYYDLRRAFEERRDPSLPAPPRATPSDFLAQLHRLEAQREQRDRRAEDRVRCASYADPDRSRPSSAAHWVSGTRDVVAVLSGTGGQHAGHALTLLMQRAMQDGRAADLRARATEPIERAHAAALAALGPAFVAGGTMACVAFTEERAVVAHVGDACVLRLTRARCERLTTDHLLVWPNGPARTLSRAVGIADGFGIDTNEITVAADEALLLATADVWKHYDEAALLALYRERGATTPEGIAARVRVERPTGAIGAALVLPPQGPAAYPDGAC